MTIYTVIPYHYRTSIMEGSVKSFTTYDAAVSYADDTSECYSIVENEVVDFLEDEENE